MADIELQQLTEEDQAAGQSAQLRDDSFIDEPLVRDTENQIHGVPEARRTSDIHTHHAGWEYQILWQETTPASTTREPPDSPNSTSCRECSYFMCCSRFNCCSEAEDRGENSKRLLRTAIKGGLWVLFSLIMPSMRGKIFKYWLVLQFIASLLLVGLSAAVLNLNAHHWNLISVIAYSIWAALTVLDILVHTLMKFHYRTISRQFIAGCSFFRLLYTTACLSIALMCDIFQLAVAFPDIHDGSGRVILARALLNFISFISFVYCVVIVLVGITARATSKLLAKDPSTTVKKFPTKFFITFLMHLVGQAIVQLCMLLTVTRRLNQDYPNIDIYLWTIVVLASIIPIAGTLMYIALNIFWIQQFFIGIFTTLLSIDEDSIASLDLDVTQQQRIEQFRHSLNMGFLRQEAADLNDKQFTYKFLFTFQSPLAIILSALYTVVLVLFPVFTILKTMHTDQISVIVSALGSSLGWEIFFYISVGLYVLFNIQAIAVSIYWLTVFLIILSVTVCLCYIATKYPNWSTNAMFVSIECLFTCKCKK